MALLVSEAWLGVPSAGGVFLDGKNDTLHCPPLAPGHNLPSTGCNMSETQHVVAGATAIIRILTSVLSILGAFSIIISVIIKRKICSSKVHPIFVLSIADLLLSIMWVTGGVLWLKGVRRAACFSVSLITVILECVTINLTLVYAIIAYTYTKHTNPQNLLFLVHYKMTHALKPWKICALYSIAWLLPPLLVLVPFGVFASLYSLIEDANNCSCWCRPVFGNVLPLPGNKPGLPYIRNLGKLIVTYGVVVSFHYLLVFPLLVFVYCKVLRHIKKIRRVHELNQNTPGYGATEALLVRGQSQAKRRVLYFLAVFIISGFCNLVLAIVVVVNVSIHLAKHTFNTHHHPDAILIGVYLIQSVTSPLQGFLNALIYGWTRDDFLQAIAKAPSSYSQSVVVGERSTELSEDSVDSISRREYFRSPVVSWGSPLN